MDRHQLDAEFYMNIKRARELQLLGSQAFSLQSKSAADMKQMIVPSFCGDTNTHSNRPSFIPRNYHRQNPLLHMKHLDA
jgi:hypothetical protein